MLNKLEKMKLGPRKLKSSPSIVLTPQG